MKNNFDQYEALLLSKNWEALSPEERRLALSFGNRDDFENKRQLLKETRQQPEAPKDLTALSQRLQQHIPSPAPSHSWRYWQMAATALLLMAVAGFVGYHIGRQSVPTPPIQIKEVASTDTLWLEKIVEKPVEVVRYKDRPSPKVKQARQDSFVIASGKSLGESKELLQFVERRGM